MFRRQICSGLCSQILQRVRLSGHSGLRLTTYIQLFRRYAIIHAGNDLLRNAVDQVNIRQDGDH